MKHILIAIALFSCKKDSSYTTIIVPIGAITEYGGTHPCKLYVGTGNPIGAVNLVIYNQNCAYNALSDSLITDTSK